MDDLWVWLVLIFIFISGCCAGFLIKEEIAECLIYEVKKVCEASLTSVEIDCKEVKECVKWSYK